MSIPNIPSLYQRIAKGSEGGHEFARIMKLLLTAHYESLGERLVAISDASGDYRKLDAYIVDNEDSDLIDTGFQFKFLPSNLTSSHKKQLTDSIEAALSGNALIYDFILVTPEDFMKEQQDWLETVRKKYKSKEYRHGGSLAKFKILHWGHTKIVELCLKHDHIGCLCFPELFLGGVGRLKLNSAAIDCKNSNWTASKNSRYSYWQHTGTEKEGLVTDPLFDFCFTNNSNEIFLLSKIELHLEKVYTQIKGIPAEHILKSIGAMPYKVDFKKPVNTIELPDPIKFPAKEALRFQLQLIDFTKDCPGNTVQLKFWFYFGEVILLTNSFYLSF